MASRSPSHNNRTLGGDLYFLYLDESGNPDSAEDRHFVLAGLAIHESRTDVVSRELDRLQQSIFPNRPPIDFHVSPMRAGKGVWRDLTKDDRERHIDSLIDIVTRQDDRVALFASVVEKDALRYGEAAVKDATEQITKRFDTFLRRQLTERQSKQRGLLVFAEGRFHDRARIWVKGFKELGTKWGVISNLSDIPYFASARESRPLQLADLVAYTIFTAYERNEIDRAKKLLTRFDQKGGVIHGISHYTFDKTCRCAACASRRMPNDFGTWI
jgi:hypothetical protein